MELQNTGRKKLRYRFALLYISSIILLAIIFTALWNMVNSTGQTSVQNVAVSDSDEHELLRMDELLHADLKKLQQMDDVYAKLVSGSAGAQELDSLNQAIYMAEDIFNAGIDSLEQQKSVFKNRPGLVKFDSITAAFKATLASRRSFGNIRSMLSGENLNLSTGKRDLLNLKMALMEKDNNILALQNQLKTGRQLPAGSSSTTLETDFESEIESLKSTIKSNEDKIASLVANSNSITKDNNHLNVLITELRSVAAKAGGTDKSDNDKIEVLQNKINDLSAMLILAKVDCNLSRADAKQIISNSRQRKDLLQESLNSLNDLSRFNNVAIQKKAKEKLSQLQSIVQTVRD